MGAALCGLGTILVTWMSAAVSVTKDILYVRSESSSGLMFIGLRRDLKDAVPLLVEPRECVLPVVFRYLHPKGQRVIVSPMLPAGRYTIAMGRKEGREEAVGVQIADRQFPEESLEVEWSTWCHRWGKFFEGEGRYAEAATVYALGRAFLGHALFPYITHTGMVTGGGATERNEAWHRTALADALQKGDWDRVTTLGLAYCFFGGSPPAGVLPEILRHVPPDKVREHIPEGAKLGVELFGHLKLFSGPPEEYLREVVARWHRVPADETCLSSRERPADVQVKAWIAAIDYPDWVRTSDGKPVSELAVRALNRFFQFDLDISDLTVEARTCVREKLETWVREIRRRSPLPSREGQETEWAPPRLDWDKERGVFTYPEPPDLSVEADAREPPPPARPVSAGWLPGFAAGVGAGVLLAVFCYLVARVLRRRLSRGE